MTRKLLPVAEIIALYCDVQLSCDAIAARYGVWPTSVGKLLRRHQVPRRLHREAARLAVQTGRFTPPWRGKRLSREHRYKIGRRGPQHPRWRTGIWMRPWRKRPKTECASCGTTTRLCNVHRNNDFTDWREANRIVLCVSCHRAHRKRQFWRAARAREKLLPYNGPVGWHLQRQREVMRHEEGTDL